MRGSASGSPPSAIFFFVPGVVKCVDICVCECACQKKDGVQPYVIFSWCVLCCVVLVCALFCQCLHTFRRTAHETGLAHMSGEVEAEMGILAKVVQAKDTLVTHGAAGCLQASAFVFVRRGEPKRPGGGVYFVSELCWLNRFTALLHSRRFAVSYTLVILVFMVDLRFLQRHGSCFFWHWLFHVEGWPLLATPRRVRSTNLPLPSIELLHRRSNAIVVYRYLYGLFCAVLFPPGVGFWISSGGQRGSV